MATHRKLYRSDKNRMVAGIFAGIEDFAGVDATVMRVIFVVFVIFTGVFPGVLAYFLAALIIPSEREKHHPIHESVERR